MPSGASLITLPQDWICFDPNGRISVRLRGYFIRLQPFPFANICERKLPFLFSFCLRIHENNLQTVFKWLNGFEWITDPAKTCRNFMGI
jgi:hypothetical protein